MLPEAHELCHSPRGGPIPALPPAWRDTAYLQDVGCAAERVRLAAQVEGDVGQLGDSVAVNHVLREEETVLSPGLGRGVGQGHGAGFCSPLLQPFLLPLWLSSARTRGRLGR